MTLPPCSDIRFISNTFKKIHFQSTFNSAIFEGACQDSLFGYITQTNVVNYLGHGWSLSLSRPAGNVGLQIEFRSVHCASEDSCCAACEEMENSLF